MNVPAVFLDRDGTLIEDSGYVGDPDDVVLLDGAAGAVCRCARAGLKVVVVSNQSGIARGYFDEDALAEVHARMEELLDEEGASLDGAYYCPFLAGKEAKVERFRRDSELRKPKAGMLQQASRELDIDLSRSWMVGDSPSDVEAGVRAGCRTILLQPGGASKPSGKFRPDFTVATLAQAAEIVEREMSKKREPHSDSPAPAPGRDDEIVELLSRIYEQNERSNRLSRQSDFSTLRLFGALLQMLAVVVAMWGFAALVDDLAPVATARFVLACFFQLASVTAFAIDRFR